MLAMDGVLIDQLVPVSVAERTYVLPAMKDGVSRFLTVGQIVDLVIGAAPGQLDTLDELAAALGDDANFAATIIAELASKAAAVDVDIHNLPEKLVLADTDEFRISDNAAQWNFKKHSYASLKQQLLDALAARFNSPGGAPLHAIRAWVNFNATGTLAIRAGSNVASVIDNGVGDFTINMTTAMPDQNYVVNVTTSAYTVNRVDVLSASAFRVFCSASGLVDADRVMISVTR